MLTIITGWSPSGYEEYGRRFDATFHEYGVWWQAKLVVYGEEWCPLEGFGEYAEYRSLNSIPGCPEFLVKWRGNPLANGRQKHPQHNWKPRAIEKGYNWRYDAWKFSRQGFIPYHAAKQLQQGDLLCWLDGDVVFHRLLPPRFLESLLPPGKDVAYLGRGAKHSEIGFQLYRLTPSVMWFLHDFSEIYASDRVFHLPEWHSAYVWDFCRSRHPEINFHDLTPGGSGHVWHQSPLRVYMDHLKGDRKQKGRSDERIG